MKKVTILVFILNILFVSSFTYANSGPTYWSGYPSSEILSIDESNSIAVEKEDLIFDFTMDEKLKGPSYSISSLVTAKYTMINLSEEDQTIQMAFPFISTIQGFDPEAIDIKVNDERIPFEVFIAMTTSTINELSLPTPSLSPVTPLKLRRRGVYPLVWSPPKAQCMGHYPLLSMRPKS